VTDKPVPALADFHNKQMDGLEFCSKVYALYESIRNAPDGVTRMRMRPSSLEKKLLEELLPICKYVQASYRPGRYISVRWVHGNQAYDAEVRQRGAYVGPNLYPETGFLEVTCAMHPNEHLSRHLLEQQATSFGLDGLRRLRGGKIESVPVVQKNKDFVYSYSKLLLEQVIKKASVSYPDNTTLIVQCSLNYPYMPDEWELLLSEVEARLSETSFREIYLYATVGEYSSCVYPRKSS
jgi:hypothetical protein